MANKSYPYFNLLLSQLKNKNSGVEKSFGRHVHWGYWQDPLLASGSDDDYAIAAENLTKKICAIANIQNNQSVLDVGCGFGGTIAYINENYHGMGLMGVNIDNRQLERAEKIVSAELNNKITFTEADACALPYNNIQFDRVLAVECIFHFPSREKFFEQAHRVLKVGGSLTLSDFIPATSFLPITRLLSMHIIQKYSLFGSCDIRCSLNQYQQLADKYGFALEAIDITINTLPTYDYIKSILPSLTKNIKLKPIANATIPIIQFISKQGFLKYQILNFKKLQ